MSIESLVNQNYNRLSESDHAVWNYLAAHRRECENIAIGRLAQKCCVSRTAVMRFAQKLGFQGFAELKIHLKLDNQKIKPSSDLDHICQLYQRAMDSMREKNCDDLFAAFDGAKQHFLCGEGMVQASIKKEFKRIFMSAGFVLYDTPSGQEIQNLLPVITGDDFCVLISVSGENQKMIELARQLRIRGVPMMSITKNRENTLSQLCDFHLYIDISEFIETPIHWNYESTTSYFILIEIFFLKYLDYQQRKECAHASGDPCTTKL